MAARCPALTPDMYSLTNRFAREYLQTTLGLPLVEATAVASIYPSLHNF